MSADRRDYMREFHGRRRALTRANGGIAPTGDHGSISTAANWGCQCHPCRQVRSASTKKSRADRFAQTAANGWVAPVDAHGTRSTYTDWGCRCDACRAADTTYQRQLRRKRREAS